MTIATVIDPLSLLLLPDPQDHKAFKVFKAIKGQQDLLVLDKQVHKVMMLPDQPVIQVHKALMVLVKQVLLDHWAQALLVLKVLMVLDPLVHKAIKVLLVTVGHKVCEDRLVIMAIWAQQALPERKEYRDLQDLQDLLDHKVLNTKQL